MYTNKLMEKQKHSDFLFPALRVGNVGYLNNNQIKSTIIHIVFFISIRFTYYGEKKINQCRLVQAQYIHTYKRFHYRLYFSLTRSKYKISLKKNQKTRTLLRVIIITKYSNLFNYQ